MSGNSTTDRLQTRETMLLDLLRQAAGRPLTADDIRAQRISWCVGQTGASREDVERIVDRG